MIEMTWPMHQRCECRLFGSVVSLTPFQRDMLLLLLLRRGRPVSVNEIIESLYHPDFEPDFAYKCVHTQICHLRKKLPGVIKRHTETRKGSFGYVVDLPDEMRIAA